MAVPVGTAGRVTHGYPAVRDFTVKVTSRRCRRSPQCQSRSLACRRVAPERQTIIRPCCLVTPALSDKIPSTGSRISAIQAAAYLVESLHRQSASSDWKTTFD
ncbi:hypothetical protein AAFF_G00113610 [Aldrovandia affinis]|uniref:Uncharacterized protein n=1 Tax=Aldrovandia affinis TaxID=143900 RepID=A0AAD7WAG2_9TELE|nr:hypothetical protein AAFF_G00113610 [Aldrovandia affinis]